MNITKEITYDTVTKDYAMIINGEVIGYARSYLEANRLINEYVYEALRRGTLVTQTDAAQEQEEAEVDVLEGQYKDANRDADYHLSLAIQADNVVRAITKKYAYLTSYRIEDMYQYQRVQRIITRATQRRTRREKASRAATAIAITAKRAYIDSLLATKKKIDLAPQLEEQEEVPNNLDTFKVGDKVMVVCGSDQLNNIGEIVGVDDDVYQYKVAFDHGVTALIYPNWLMPVEIKREVTDTALADMITRYDRALAELKEIKASLERVAEELRLTPAAAARVAYAARPTWPVAA